MYNEEIYLVSGETVDEVGDVVRSGARRMVYAKMLSVGIKEFYQAQTEGMKPELKFVIADYLDYHGEKNLIHNKINYKILRTYRTNKELEITVYGGVHHAET